MPPEFTVDWFSEHIPVWEKYVLPRMGEHPTYLEIGSFEGRSLCWMLDHVPNLNAESIDPHLINATSWERLAKNVSGRATLHRAYSRVQLTRTIIGEYSAIYIDGSHWTDDALSDSVLSWPLLKIGGVMIWDDYEWPYERCELERPKPAIDAFLACYRGAYTLLHKGYQVLIEKTHENNHGLA